MPIREMIDRAMLSRKFLPILAVVGAVSILAIFAFAGSLFGGNTVRPADADITHSTATEQDGTDIDQVVIDPDLDLRFSDPIVRIIPGEHLLTIRGTVMGIPMDHITARIGYRQADGQIVEAMGSSQLTVPTDEPGSNSRQINFDDPYRQFEIPDSLRGEAEVLVLLYSDDSDNPLVMTTGAWIDADDL